MIAERPAAYSSGRRSAVRMLQPQGQLRPGDPRADRTQRRVAAHHGGELREPEVRVSPHDDIAVAPRLLPTNDEALALERGRVMMAAESDAHFNVQNFYDTWEEKTRELIADYLPPTVPPERKEFYVDLVRVIQNGVILSAVEHPKYWTPAKREAFIDALMPLLGQADGHRTVSAVRALTEPGGWMVKPPSVRDIDLDLLNG